MRACCVCKLNDCDAKKRTASSFANPHVKLCEHCGIHFQTKVLCSFFFSFSVPTLRLQKCYLNHIAYTACDKYQYHDVCGAIVERESLVDGSHKEKCAMRTCADCDSTYKENPAQPHMCFITRADPEKLGLPKQYVIAAFDFETSMDKDTQQHMPYCVTAIRLMLYKSF